MQHEHSNMMNIISLTHLFSMDFWVLAGPNRTVGKYQFLPTIWHRDPEQDHGRKSIALITKAIALSLRADRRRYEPGFTLSSVTPIGVSKLAEIA
jgi:hypothetical protein